ncbi:hypothetical protein EYE35_20995 [Cereibacter sphaeroides]|nr:hypothetical protein EYE35_20995 [Cereibacter sphaeroides]
MKALALAVALLAAGPANAGMKDGNRHVLFGIYLKAVFARAECGVGGGMDEAMQMAGTLAEARHPQDPWNRDKLLAEMKDDAERSSYIAAIGGCDMGFIPAAYQLLTVTTDALTAR